MYTFALLFFLLCCICALIGRFNVFYGAIIGFAIYHHSLVLVYFSDEGVGYSDWVKFTNTEIPYLVTFILLLLLFSAIITSHSLKNRLLLKPKDLKRTELKFIRLMSFVSLAAVVCIFLIFGEALNLSKKELIEGSASFFGIASYGFMMVFLVAYLSKDKSSIAMALLALILLSVFLVSRSTVIIPLIGAIFHSLQGKRLVSLLTPARFLTIAILGIIGVYGKYVAIGLRRGDFSALFDQLHSFSLSSLMLNLEGYHISTYIADIVAFPKPYEITDSLDAFYQFLVIPSLFGADSQSFTKYLANSYRPDATYGLAYSFFGEGYAIGGLFGVVVWTLILVGMLSITQLFIKSHISIWAKAWICFAVGLLCFYYPRNSLEVCLVMLRLTALSSIVIFGCWLLYSFLKTEALRFNNASRARKPELFEALCRLPEIDGRTESLSYMKFKER